MSATQNQDAMGATTATTTKTVTVIVPCRNEHDHIEAFCASVAAQSLPEGWKLEVLIADGLSDDGTRERLTAWCQRDPRFVMLDNPGRIVSCGLNRCIERARGAFIVRLDVHTVYAADYIEQCLGVWRATGADNVGGPWRAEGGTEPEQVVQRAIAAAFQSRWVAGGARSRDLTYDGPVDTVYLGAWPRETFERFGRFDEQLVRNQDDEHNLRIHLGGGRVWQSPRIRSTYHPRASVADVFRQYRQYGYWKPFVMKKHGQAASIRHLVPGFFVATIGVLLVLSLLFGMDGAGSLLRLLCLVYIAAVVGVSMVIARSHQQDKGQRLLSHLPAVIAAYHFGYGLGSLRGWWDVLVRGRPDPSFGRLTRGSADKR